MRGIARGLGRILGETWDIRERPRSGGGRLFVGWRFEVGQIKFGAGLVVGDAVFGHYLFFDFLDRGVVEFAATKECAVDQSGALPLESLGDLSALAFGIVFGAALLELGAQILDLLIAGQLIIR